MKFTKMHGAGNDYIYVNCLDRPLSVDPAGLAVQISDRHKGAGSDGLILICPSEVAHARMRMFNADGSEAEMCGNGVRCVAKYVYDKGLARAPQLRIETGRGVLTLNLEIEAGHVKRVRVNMGRPILRATEIPTLLPGDPPVGQMLEVAGRVFPVTCVSMGNPHCVTFVDQLSDEWVHTVGPQIESHRVFPRRVNAEFVELVSPTEIRMRVWERGSGETQACGTGACAAAVAGVLNGVTERSVLAHLPGGDLELEWTSAGEVFLTGEAVEVYEGEWPL
jgi:diaminopimelate epimerase